MGLLQPLPISQRPWSHIAIDFITDMPLSRGSTTILTVIDCFSKACRLIPLPKLPTALETAESLCNHVFRFYGLPEDLVSDRGPQFTSCVWSAFCHNPNYQPGQWVWLSTRDQCLQLPCRTLSPRYVGPFKIIRQITPVSFRLALPANYRISPTFHVSLLKPAGGSRGVEDQEEAGDQGAFPIIIDGEEVYRVKEVLDSRCRGRVLQYLVDWEGYGPEERSWVNAEEILDPSLTTDFHRAHPNKPARDPRVSQGGQGAGGNLSKIRPLWLPPITTRGILLLSTSQFIRTSIPTTSCLGLITRTVVSH